MSNIIRLPYGGGASFDVQILIDHISKSGRNYIIQGTQQDTLDKHRKPNSLDVWLRVNVAPRHRDTAQSTNDVIAQLVETGYFREGKFECPDSDHSRLLKGIELVSQ